jgi:hypothetical protein
MAALDWRKSAAHDLERLEELHRRVDDRQSETRLLRDRLWRLRIDLPCQALDEAIEHIDSAILCLGEARRHLEGSQ